MKVVIVVRILALVAFGICAEKLHAQTAKGDTVFLVKESLGEQHHTIFIAPGKEPDVIRGAKVPRILEQDLPDLISEMHSAGIRVKHLSGHNVPRRWVALNQYQGKLYRYQPCNGSDLHTFITDSTIVDYSMESTPALLEAITLSGDSIVRIKSLYTCTNCQAGANSPGDSLIAQLPAKSSSQDKRPVSVRRHTKTIFIVDPATRLAVWEEGLGWNLMVPAENAEQYPLIACNCGPGVSPDPEFKDFEQIELPLFCKNGVPPLRGQDKGYYHTTPVQEAK